MAQQVFQNRIMQGTLQLQVLPDEQSDVVTMFSRRTLKMLIEKEGFGLLSIGSSGKVLTFKYMAKILEKENPLLGKSPRIFTRRTPVYNKPITFNMGFAVGIAKKES